MICTKINMFGRVAVRKDMAIKFLGLEGGAGLVEQIKHEDEDDWSERLAAASSSKYAATASSSAAAVKPQLADELAPWSLAGGSRKDKIRKEESERADMLKRYLEGASDESSDDEDEFVPNPRRDGQGQGQVGVSPGQRPDRRRRARQPPRPSTSCLSLVVLQPLGGRQSRAVDCSAAPCAAGHCAWCRCVPLRGADRQWHGLNDCVSFVQDVASPRVQQSRRRGPAYASMVVPFVVSSRCGTPPLSGHGWRVHPRLSSVQAHSRAT